MAQHKHFSPAQIVILGFLALILFGALLLMLPVASSTREATPFFDALFTATSATCVTGLVVFDTATHWSLFGQAVILVLIQIGGMGVVTMAIAVSLFTGKRIGIGQRYLMQESISAPQIGGIVRMTGFILRATLLFELLGAAALATRFCAMPELGFFKGIWYAVFHSVSAFCNAGFDLMGSAGAPFVSLTGFVGDPVVNITIMLLIIIGGIGFFVWHDVYTNRLHLRAYRLQTKIVLVTTALLIALPALFFGLHVFSTPEWAGLSGGERALSAAFQSVTTRTAGFNTVDLTQLSGAAVLVMIPLMLIGGSPGSTAGGMKTTTFSVFLLSVRAAIRRRESVQCFGRRLQSDALRNAAAIGSLYLLLFFGAGLLLCCVDGVAVRDALFETASAVGTVGLSMGITAGLSRVSQFALILLMYFGRVGGLTLLYAVAGGYAPVPSQMPQEKITIG